MPSWFMAAITATAPPACQFRMFRFSGSLALPTTGTGVIILRNGNGNIVDRVVYNASTLPTNCSMSRFPTLNSAFVPQSFISTNVATAGLQYDGGSWTAPPKFHELGFRHQRDQQTAFITFTANTTQANTLWQSPDLTSPFQVITARNSAPPRVCSV